MEASRTLARIAVSDPLPMFRRGVADVLQNSGYDVESPVNLLAWVAAGDDRAVVLLTLLRPADWTLLVTLRESRSTVTLIAVIESGDLALSVRALSLGAVGVMAREADFDTVRDVLVAATSGRSVLPVEVVRALTATGDVQRPDRIPPETEISWIRQLAQGLTVARLAEGAGYSERMMFRLLRDLYRHWGVANRTEAIIHARDNGWL
ncbi:DNA-binding response regulator [Amycolatopsis japonica]